MSNYHKIRGTANVILREIERSDHELETVERRVERIRSLADNAAEAANRRDKGDKNELKAQKILNSMSGMRCEKVMQRSGDEYDYLGMADLLGLHRESGDLWLVQVKTNSDYSAVDMAKYAFAARLHLDPDMHHFEVWDRIDRDGWEIHRWDRHMSSDEQGYFVDDRVGGMRFVNDIDVMNKPGTIAEIIADDRRMLERGGGHSRHRKRGIVAELGLDDVWSDIRHAEYGDDVTWKGVRDE